MRSGSLTTVFALLLAVSSVAKAARAGEGAAASHTPSAEGSGGGTAGGPDGNESHAAPITSEAALVRATAAYEYGDMAEVVDATRPVAEGKLPATPAERAQALRLLGIGLYLTGRSLGAENAFSELLRVNPKARLNRTTTRPEVVAFFENIRRRQPAPEQGGHWWIWNLLPPVGQFQNGQWGKGFGVLGVEVAAGAAFVGSGILLRHWHHTDDTMGDQGDRTSDARILRYANWASCGILAATYLYGVIDGFLNRPKQEEAEGVSLTIYPFAAGAGMRLTF